jgi:signal transduction histidine kinase
VLGEDIEMRVNLGQNLGRVKADSGHIEQVLLNLAINARAAMPLGEKLSIETRHSDGRDNGFRGYPPNLPVHTFC